MNRFLFVHRPMLLLGLGVLVSACSPEKETPTRVKREIVALPPSHSVIHSTLADQAKKEYQILNQFIEKTNRDLNAKNSSDLERVNVLLEEKIKEAENLSLQDAEVNQLRALEIQYLLANQELNDALEKVDAPVILQKSNEVEELLDRFSRLQQAFKAKYQMH